MNDGMISQEEIDALLKKSGDTKAKITTLTDEDKDIIGEIGNISMSTAATTLSQILNKKVSITTPRVSCQLLEEVLESILTPKIVATVSFKEGLQGNNLFMVDITDAAIIADLMMGGSGEIESTEMTEIQQSAVAEAMNQMIGSASTAMATLINQGIDINPPTISLWESLKENKIKEIDVKTHVCKIEFDLEVEGLIKSKIMQFYEKETVSHIIDSVKGVEEVEDVVVSKEDGNTEMNNSNNQNSNNQTVKEKPVTVQKPLFDELTPSNNENKSPRNLDLIMDVPLEFSVVLGKSKKTIKDILSFGSGSIVELNKQADEPLDIYVNGKMIAQGEVVVINENFGIRITNILSKEQRVKGL